MGGYLSLLRPGNGLVALVAVAAGAVASAGPKALAPPLLAPVAAAALAAFVFVGAGNALNDFYDRETDKRAHPDRPIPSGRVRPGAAHAVSALLFLVALALGAWVSPWAFLVVGTSAVVMFGYEWGLKAAGLPGNLAIGYLSGITLLFGAVAAGDGLPALPLALLAILASIGREVAKDIEDMEADRDRHTLPQRVGAARASRASAAFTVAAVALAPLPLLPPTSFGAAYLPLIAAAVATFIYAARLVGKSPGRSQRWSKAGFALATVAFAVGGWFP